MACEYVSPDVLNFYQTSENFLVVPLILLRFARPEVLWTFCKVARNQWNIIVSGFAVSRRVSRSSSEAPDVRMSVCGIFLGPGEIKMARLGRYQ